jgi:uridylate kinase
MWPPSSRSTPRPKAKPVASPAYKRIVLKLSGEVLEGTAANGPIDFGTIGQFCDELAEVHAMGVQIGLVVGGGNIFRGVSGLGTGLDQPTGDYMGMLATVINALACRPRSSSAAYPRA